MDAGNRVVRSLFLLCFIVVAAPLLAQQTGEITGRVTAVDGSALPGVTVEARSTVLPQPRTAFTGPNGEYRLPVLPPGPYSLTFTLAGMQTVTRNVQVLLNQTAAVSVSLGLEGVAEEITVTAQATLVDPDSTAIKTAVSEEVIDRVPTGQDYRDLLKLIPAVQVTEAEVRGPSAGGSEQDNVYLFDGVNVTLPLFGTLAAEPSSHDIEQISIVKGGAKAVDFNRSAGFTIDSISKSGTNEWTGQVKYQIRSDALTSDLASGSSLQFEEDRTWGSLGIGGPVLRDRLLFYGSYYRPTRSRANSSNVYGDVPDFDSVRNEYFGKLTFTPTGRILLHASYRDSDRTDEFASIGAAEAPTAALNEESKQTIGIIEGSWVITDSSFATFNYTDYALKGASTPNVLLDVVPSLNLGTQLDINNLDRMGYVVVPCPNQRPSSSTPCILSAAGPSAFNTFITPFIDKYGFDRGGERAGGGAVGGGLEINDQDFFRESAQIGYDFRFGGVVSHDLHVGYQWSKDREDLARFRNGWGLITVPGGTTNCPANTACAGQPVFFQAELQRSSEASLGRQVITSEFESQNFEINDTIGWGNWSFNVGVMLSDDTLFGQGLREDSSTISGYVSAPGNKYKMYEIPWEKQIQPRLGATWAYNGSDTVWASYAKYNPAASSLPRAASWDRNTLGLVSVGYFDANGVLIGSEQLAGSSGKLFVDDLDPRYTDEFMIGSAQQFTNRWSGRAYARYRYSTNFWEDTNNNARSRFNAPEGISREDYIPDLTAKRDQIGSGSTYVIAELDGAFTKYYEVSLESDYAVGNVNLRGSYTWSHYYGNFDQDNTSQTYDFSTFIGSSNIADGGGRQLWDNKYGDLHGDRRHLLKVYGFYNLPWNASAGAFALYQSGHAWEEWSWVPYGPDGQNIIGGNRSDTNRYAEPAGSRRTDDHYQIDFNYTQDVPIGGYNIQIIADLYNMFDKQTGYSPQPAVHNALFGEPRLRHAPRRVELAVRLQF